MRIGKYHVTHPSHKTMHTTGSTLTPKDETDNTRLQTFGGDCLRFLVLGESLMICLLICQVLLTWVTMNAVLWVMSMSMAMMWSFTSDTDCQVHNKTITLTFQTNPSTDMQWQTVSSHRHVSLKITKANSKPSVASGVRTLQDKSQCHQQDNSKQNSSIHSKPNKKQMKTLHRWHKNCSLSHTLTLDALA